MTLIDYFLLSILYFWASSTAISFGVGYYTIYRPVISGFLTGLILGNATMGMVAGAVVNIIYIDFVSTGGSFKGDQCLTAIIAAISAIFFELSPVEAAAAAYLFGFLGILIWKYRLNINSVFVKKYENEYEKGNTPEISLYDGLFPQLLLYVMSTAVLVAAIFTMLLLQDFIINIRNILFIAGLYLVYISTWNIMQKIGNKKSFFILLATFLITLFFKPSTYITFIIAIIIFILSNKGFKINTNNNLNKNSIINKKDLTYSWFIWMNFSHSCYSYERLQGMAFAHSMKNIFKKLYKNNNEIADAIHRHSEIFNTEPNMGTPIHGYIISLEEKQISDENTNNIMYIKKGMMGIAAGLGDSYTQVILTPLFVSMSIMLCFDNSYTLALIPIILLAFSILYISYTGFMNGYYDGKESLIERINIIKNIKIKKYFPYIFSGILGVSLGKLLMFNYDKIYENLKVNLAILIISFVYAMIKNKRSTG